MFGLAGPLLAFTLSGCGQQDQQDAPSTPPDQSVVSESATNTPPANTPPADTSPAATSPEQAAIYASLDDAIATLQAEDIRRFVEYHLPYTELQAMRRGGAEEYEKRLAVMTTLPTSVAKLKTLIPILEAARRSVPEIDTAAGTAVLSLASTDPALQVAAETPPPMPAETTSVAILGYGDDLSLVIDRSIMALEGGDIQAFVAHMFPAGELRRPDAAEQLKVLTDRLTVHPNMVSDMVAELKLINDLTPEAESTPAESIFRIPGESSGRYRTADRIVKFQKVDGSWRFYDATTTFRQQQADVARLPYPVVEDPIQSQLSSTIVMERIGDKWRLRRFPPLPR